MTDAAPRRHPDAAWIIVVLAAVCSGLHIWDLPAAIPFITGQIAMTLVQAGALLGVVQLAGMAGGLAVSLLAELIGGRRCLLAGLTLESLGSACGALAHSVTALLVSRAIEGAGSILIVVTGPGLIGRHAPPARINTAIGYWGAFTGIAAAAGLAGSAVFLQVAPWRLLWWAMTALTLAPLPLAAALLPDEPRGVSGVSAATQRIGATVRSLRPWIAGLAFACYTIQWMTVVGLLPTICAQDGLRGIWPGILTALAGGVSAVGSVSTAPLLQRGVPVRALLIPAFAAMAVTAVLAFAVNWTVLPAGHILQAACVAAFSFSGAAIPASLFRVAVDLAPPTGSTSATIGLMQQLFNAGSAAGPAITAWLVTRAGSWQPAWWMSCTFAVLGGLLSLYLSERRLGTTFGRPRPGRTPADHAGHTSSGREPGAGPAALPARTWYRPAEPRAARRSGPDEFTVGGPGLRILPDLPAGKRGRGNLKASQSSTAWAGSSSARAGPTVLFPDPDYRTRADPCRLCTN